MKNLFTIILISLCMLASAIKVSGQPYRIVWERKNNQKTRALMQDHYYYKYPYENNIGVRFNGGITDGSAVYQGGTATNSNSFIIDGKSSVEFSASFITEENAGDFLYHVIVNDKAEIVPWSKPSDFKYTANKAQKYAYLGKFEYEGDRKIKIEVYNIKEYGQRDAIQIDWHKIARPVAMGAIQYTIPHMPLPGNEVYTYNLEKLKVTTYHTSEMVKGKWIEVEKKAINSFSETTDENDPKFRLADSVKNLRFDIGNYDGYPYAVGLKRVINGKTDSVFLGEKINTFDLYKEFWKEPGVYYLTFTPVLHSIGGNPIKIFHNLATNIHFTVLPDLHTQNTLPLKTVAFIILIILTTGGFMFMIYRRDQKRKLARQAKDKQIATLQLASVRAQLNPHFIFNALAGIQNLMNKNEVENANKYLSRFARLTRNILDDGDKELTTIEHEVSLLTDYLQMEQTRFGFNFSIEVDANKIDQQVEMPAMLLQPFAENAVKHGVSALKDKGMITIGIVKQGSSLLLTVKDNGKGFSGDVSTGMGLKLCKERIALLNSIYKNTTILLQQTSGNEGTVITVELRGWV